jgi:hypothetical protein
VWIRAIEKSNDMNEYELSELASMKIALAFLSKYGVIIFYFVVCTCCRFGIPAVSNTGIY